MDARALRLHVLRRRLGRWMQRGDAMKRRRRSHTKRNRQRLAPDGCGHWSASSSVCLGGEAHNRSCSDGELIGYISNLSGSERCILTLVKAGGSAADGC
jgi:hypothetical protein